MTDSKRAAAEREAAVLRYIVEEWTRTGRYPVLRQIGERFRLTPGGAQYYLLRLAAAGYVRQERPAGAGTAAGTYYVPGLADAVRPAAEEFARKFLPPSPPVQHA